MGAGGGRGRERRGGERRVARGVRGDVGLLKLFKVDSDHAYTRMESEIFLLIAAQGKGVLRVWGFSLVEGFHVTEYAPGHCLCGVPGHASHC